MSLRLIILFLLVSTTSHGQINFTVQTKPLLEHFSYRWVDSAFKLPGNNEFELRLLAGSHLKIDQQCCILSLEKGKWSARMFVMVDAGNSFTFREVFSTLPAEALWQKLMDKKVLTLTGMDDLQKAVDADSTWNILDGKFYSFQLINHKGHRQFYFHSPEAYASHFKTMKEFELAADILASVYRHFGLRP